MEFLGAPLETARPLYVVHGDEPFLKRLVLRSIRRLVLGDAESEGAASVHAGDQATLADVMDDLDTLPFFAPRRLVVVEHADRFVTQYRAQLEKAVLSLPATATLVLEVKSWKANTKLAKLVDSAATIGCTAPKRYQLPAWCASWAKTQYHKQMPMAAAQLLVELAGTEMGVLDQEVRKLAVSVGERGQINTADVDRLVGLGRVEKVFAILKAVAERRPGDALRLLDRHLEQGDEVLRIVGALTHQLRQLARAARLATQKMSLSAAMEKAGIDPRGLEEAELQLKHLGPARALRLFDDLLQLWLDLRGDCDLPERLQLERFLVRLARPRETVRT
ncbi:MAG: DNA polymerase III subunit delta [Gemmataceae bacterium]|nr:DNA polymerase III subunit delta [Gemmataceae bacterium]